MVSAVDSRSRGLQFCPGHRVIFLGRHLIMDTETGSSKFNVGCNNVMDCHPEEGVDSEILIDDSCYRSRK